MRFLSLFSGIGGFDLGLERAGHECVGQVEKDKFCTRVLVHRWPAVEREDDVCALRADEPGGRQDVPRIDGGTPGNSILHGAAGRVDLLVGGFPCQDLSVAGKRAGLAGSRSSLFFEFVRIGRETQAPWALIENVPGLFSSNAGLDFRAVLESLAAVWPAVGWRVLDSRYFGVAQRRRRVFIVCGPSREAVAAVLFEREGGERNPAEKRSPREEVAGTLGGGAGARGPCDDTNRTTFVTAATFTAGAHPGSHNEQDDTKDGHLIPAQAGVRRIMPVECERLQGFPDGWTCLADHEQPCDCPDGPRYRALGNAVTVSVADWIGRRLPGAAHAVETLKEGA